MFRAVLNSICLTLFFSVSIPMSATETNLIEEQILAIQSDREFQLMLDELRYREGPYGQGLVEAHQQNGQLLMQQERFESAVAAFKEAWHISRVNSGLYSEEQLPLINQMIECLTELERWEEVHDLHQLSFLIGSRVYSPDDLRYVLAAELYAAWQWEAISNNRLPNTAMGIFHSARELSEFYENTIERVEEAFAGPSVNTLNLILGKARTDLAIAQSAAQLGRNGGVLGADCRESDYHPQRRNLACPAPRQVSFGWADPMYPPVSISLAGLYITYVNDAIDRLDGILRNESMISEQERRWIQDLIRMLQLESDALLRVNRVQ